MWFKKIIKVIHCVFTKKEKENVFTKVGTTRWMHGGLIPFDMRDYLGRKLNIMLTEILRQSHSELQVTSQFSTTEKEEN